MRPRERLRRKEIPKEAIRKELERWSDRLTGWNQFFTAVVVGGLAIEYLPDAASFLGAFSHTIFFVLHSHADQLHQFGGLIVIAGIVGEFCVASRERKVESDLRDESNSEIETLRERAANAEKAAAEANLARVKIEQRMKPRSLFGAGREDLEALLSSHAGMSIDIVVYDSHVSETQFFGHLLMSSFVAAKWTCRHWEARKAKSRVSGASVLVAIADGHVDEKLIDLAEKLRAALLSLEIECDISLGRFACTGEFEPGDFQVISQHPTVLFGARGLSPFRIQIGALQLVPVSPTRIVLVRSATPPQA